MSEEITSIIENMIRDRFPGVVFDTIEVEESTDSDGDPVLRITAVFEGTLLDSAKMVGLVRHLRPKLAEKKVDSFPLVRFVSKRDASKGRREAA